MEIPGVGSSSASSTTIGNEPLVKTDEFLMLFVAQLKNQSPLDPLKGHEFMAQLAQFSSVEQLASIKTSISEMNQFQQIIGVSALVGKDVVYLSPNSGEYLEGTVDRVGASGGETYVVIQNEIVPISNIAEIF